MIDQRTNRVTLFNLIEDFSAAGFPAVHPMLTVVVIAERQMDEPSKFEHELVLRIDDQSLLRVPHRYNFRDKLRTRVLSEVQGLVLPSPGIFYAELVEGNETIAQCRLTVSSTGAQVQVMNEPVPADAAVQAEHIAPDPEGGAG